MVAIPILSNYLVVGDVQCDFAVPSGFSRIDYEKLFRPEVRFEEVEERPLSRD